MAVQRIDRIHEQVRLEQVEVEKVQQRLNLFNLNSFERVGSVDFPDGSRIDIPSMTDKDREAAAQLFSGVPTDKRAMLDQASQDLGKAIYTEASKGVSPSGHASPAAISALTSAAQAYSIANNGSVEADQAFMGTAYMGLVGLEGDLASKAKDLQSKTGLADETRTDITELNSAIADWPDGQATEHFKWTEVDKDGNVKVCEGDLTKDQAKALVDKLTMQLDNVKDMTELQKLDLQDNMQKYQQALQTFSEILKDAHDTMKATIANLKAS